MRRGALLNEAQNCGRSPTSVAGGVNARGNCPDSVGFCGPGSTALRGAPCVFTMPWGGSSGLPKLAALARVAKAPTPAAAPPARISRRDTDIFGSPIVASRTERMIGLATRSRTESGSPPLQRKADFEANDPQQGDSVTGSPTPMRSGHFDMPAQHPELGNSALSGRNRELSAKSNRAPMKHLFRGRHFAALSPTNTDRPSPGRSAAVAIARRARPLPRGDRGGRRAVASTIRDLTGLRGENRRPSSISSCSWFSTLSPAGETPRARLTDRT